MHITFLQTINIQNPSHIYPPKLSTLLLSSDQIRFRQRPPFKPRLANFRHFAIARRSRLDSGHLSLPSPSPPGISAPKLLLRSWNGNGALGPWLLHDLFTRTAHHRYSLPSPLPPVLSSSSTPLLPHPTSSYTPSSSTPSSSSSQFNPTFRVQSPFGTPVDPSSGWQIPRGSAPSILTPNFLDYPPRGRELPLPNGFGLAPLASMHGLGAPPSGAGYDYLMVSSVRGSAQGGPTNGLANEFPSAVPPLAPAANVLPPFYGGNGGAESSGPSSSTLPPFSAATAAASYAYYGLPPNHPQHAMQQQQQQQQQQQSGPSSAPPSRANSQSRNDTTGSSSSSSPKSLSPGSPIIGGGGGGAAAGGPPPFGAESFKMQLEGGGGNEFGSGQGYEFGLSAAGTVAAVGAEQGQQWA
ncbi:hypothetical protein FRC04_001137 [Tulasnella sp. 424]|nr:hypothetical protein FRC04_001137 [Tulasnella sp. 424]KAG8969373.1 hypothetical protein FRC05_001112 [Tulasnella sp. 425]